MEVYVELAESVDVTDWGRRHSRDEVPDRTPYGLDQIADPEDDVRVAFRAPLSPRGQTVSRKVRGRLGEVDPVPSLLDRHLARRRADVVLCMDERAGIPAALRGGPPVVSGLAWVDGTDGHGRVRRLGDRLVGAALNRMAGVFTQSDALVQPLQRAWDLDPTRIHLVPLGIDADFHAERPWPERGGRVFSVGDDRMRDHPTLVRAVEQVRAAGVHAELHLATTLPVRLPDDLGRLHARRMGPAVRQQYAEAEVVAIALHPNVQGSGLTALLEAMATGRPVVVSDNPGLARYVQEGVTGHLVPPGDATAMAERVAALLADPQRAQRMGQAARRRVEERFTSAHQAARLRAVLRASLAAEQRPPG